MKFSVSFSLCQVSYSRRRCISAFQQFLTVEFLFEIMPSHLVIVIICLVWDRGTGQLESQVLLCYLARLMSASPINNTQLQYPFHLQSLLFRILILRGTWLGWVQLLYLLLDLVEQSFVTFGLQMNSSCYEHEIKFD